MTDDAQNTGGYKLSLDIVNAIWDRVCGPYTGKQGVLWEPDTIVTRYERARGREMAREPVKDWGLFEYGHIDWNHRDFEKLMLQGIAPDAEVLLMTDEGLMQRVVFSFVRGRFDDFADWLEKEYKMSFFQASDYVVFDRELSYVILLHHDGWVFRG